MSHLKKHIFICTNLREAGPDSCCAGKGSLKIRERFVSRLKDLGLNTTVRANKSGCLGVCEQGVAVVIYPAQIWYGHVSLADVDEIIKKSIIGDGVIERLKI